MTLAVPPDAKTLDIPLTQVIADPADNYRWGSEEAMQEDLRTLNANGSTNVDALAESMQATGLVSPIGVVREGSKYRVIFGFNRTAAARHLGAKTIRAQVYESLDAEDRVILQLTENRKDLRRPVGWVREVEQWVRLHDAVRARIRLENPTQAKRTVEASAWNEVCEHLGRNVAATLSRVRQMRDIPPVFVEMSRDHDWTYRSTVEFYVNPSTPLPETFVSEWAKEIRRNCPTLNAEAITPGYVRACRQSVEKWLEAGRGEDGNPIWKATSTAPSVAGAPKFSYRAEPLTAPAARDLSTNLLFAAIADANLSPRSLDNDWLAVSRTAVAYRVAGIGMASGLVALNAHERDASDNTIINLKDLAERSNAYVDRAVVAAALRLFVARTHDWSKWLETRSVASKQSGVKRTNRFAYQNAIDAGMSDASTLGAKIRTAWKYLVDKGAAT